jgi:hypothetical protein
MEEVLGDISNSLEDALIINKRSPIFTTDWFSGNIAQWNNYKVEFFNKE